MLQVLFVAADGFTHGGYNFAKAGDSAVMPEYLAQELESKGLGAVKAKPRTTKMVPDPNVGGSDALQSASPAGQASPAKTSSSSGTGKQPTPRSTK